MADYSIPDPHGARTPPNGPPPRVATGALPPEPARERPRRRNLGGGLLGVLRRAECAVFGPIRTVGPRPGRTPTF